METRMDATEEYEGSIPSLVTKINNYERAIQSLFLQRGRHQRTKNL